MSIMWIVRRPSMEEFIRLLEAWRLWMLGALLGGLVAGLVYLFQPPNYKAQATVLVDHNVWEVIPYEETDLRRFNYLQQENDMLIEIAWSDSVLDQVAGVSAVSVSELRKDILNLSQPGEGGWHFTAVSADPQQAAGIAAAWAQAFYDAVRAGGPGISPLLEVELMQMGPDPVERALAPGVYIFFGSVMGAACLALGVLFIHRKEP
jgi:Chain length determinant protein